MAQILVLSSGCITTSELPDRDGDGASQGVDCDDRDPSRYPGADEVCNGLDDDCDGYVDEDAVDRLLWFRDRDGDEFGNVDEPLEACDAPAGYVADATDCDDMCADCRPGVVEVCDGRDNDCDGEADEEGAADAETMYTDADGDGYGDPDDERQVCLNLGGLAFNDDDCDDTDADVNPVAIDECGDDIDSDCNGAIDDCVFSLEDADAWAGSPEEGDAFGAVVHGPGDLDGDGLVDAAVAAPGASQSDESGGAVYLFLGPLSGDLVAATEVFGSEPYDQLGSSLGTLGLDDTDPARLLVGAETLSREVSGSGAVYAFSAGSETLDADTDADFVLWGDAATARFGAAVDGSGDIDGDGFPDIVVGEPGRDREGVDEGAVHVFYGPFTGSRTVADADVDIVHEEEGGRLGESVAIVGDTNGDGRDELLTGAWGVAAQSGEAWLMGWHSDQVQTIDDARAVVTNVVEGEQLGISVSRAGDFDADGRPDFAVGAWLADNGDRLDTGAAYVFRGPVSGAVDPSTAPIQLRSMHNAAFLGADLAAVGDVDGSGVGDLFVGAWGDPVTANGLGLGALVLDPTEDTHTVEETWPVLVGEAEGPQKIGGTVAGLGDADEDGFDDVILGGLSADARVGAVYVVNGRETW